MRVKMTRFAKKLVNRELIGAFERWFEMATEQKAIRNKIRKVLKRSLNAKLAASWNSWIEFMDIAADSRAEEEARNGMLRKALGKMLNMRLAAAFEAWKGACDMTRRMKGIARRMLNREMAMAFDNWMELVRMRQLAEAEAAAEAAEAAAAEAAAKLAAAEEAKRESKVARILAKMRNRGLAMAWATWTEHVTDIRKLRKVALRMKNRKAAMALDKWRACVAQAKSDKALLNKVMARMMKRGLFMAMSKWRAAVATAKEHRAAMRRAVLKMKNASLSKAWKTWADNVKHGRINELRQQVARRIRLSSIYSVLPLLQIVSNGAKRNLLSQEQYLSDDMKRSKVGQVHMARERDFITECDEVFSYLKKSADEPVAEMRLDDLIGRGLDIVGAQLRYLNELSSNLRIDRAEQHKILEGMERDIVEEREQRSNLVVERLRKVVESGKSRVSDNASAEGGGAKDAPTEGAGAESKGNSAAPPLVAEESVADEVADGIEVAQEMTSKVKSLISDIRSKALWRGTPKPELESSFAMRRGGRKGVLTVKSEADSDVLNLEDDEESESAYNAHLMGEGLLSHRRKHLPPANEVPQTLSDVEQVNLWVEGEALLQPPRGDSSSTALPDAGVESASGDILVDRQASVMPDADPVLMRTTLLTIERDRHAPIFDAVMDDGLAVSVSRAAAKGLASVDVAFQEPGDPVITLPEDDDEEEDIDDDIVPVPDSAVRRSEGHTPVDRPPAVSFFNSPVTIAEELTPDFDAGPLRREHTPLYQRARRNSVAIQQRTPGAALAKHGDAGEDSNERLFERREKTSSFLPPLATPQQQRREADGRHTSHGEIADVLGTVRANRKAFIESAGSIERDDVLTVGSATKFPRRAASSLA